MPSSVDQRKAKVAPSSLSLRRDDQAVKGKKVCSLPHTATLYIHISNQWYAHTFYILSFVYLSSFPEKLRRNPKPKRLKAHELE